MSTQKHGNFAREVLNYQCNIVANMFTKIIPYGKWNRAICNGSEKTDKHSSAVADWVSNVSPSDNPHRATHNVENLQTLSAMIGDNLSSDVSTSSASNTYIIAKEPSRQFARIFLRVISQIGLLLATPCSSNTSVVQRDISFYVSVTKSSILIAFVLIKYCWFRAA